MNRLALVVVALALPSLSPLALGGCDRKKQAGLPPAEEWSADHTGGMVPVGGAAGPLSPHGGMAAAADQQAGGDPSDPHAGMDMNGMGGAPGADPANPHAGLDMGAGGMGGADPSNPHAGMAGAPGGGDVTQLGLTAPDPNRPIDPNHFVRGTIKLGAAAAGKAQSGGVVFVVVKHVDANGQGTGAPLAVDRLTWPATGDLPFELSEAQAMVSGTTFDGDVIVTAHYDQDGEARSKQPGDILGEVRVKVPADNVVLPLDNVLP